ncbi:hypothetical protein [Kribbella sp. NPDC051620]|uniref:hypothetical protein n=1 Tax=Kribbella sp. NPDC051620 TaxID=3364120 RepID=UPI0037AC84E8
MKHRLLRATVACSLIPLTWLGVSAGPAAANHVTTPVIRDVSMANLAANERELHIVVDPNNADHLAAGANERGGGNSQEWYASTDGGRNWTSGNMPFGTLTVTDVGGDGDGLLMSDPALDFGAGGRIYYSALAHRDSEDPCTLFVTSSTDDGANWTDPANGVIAAGGTTICNDKEFILVDRAANDNVYVAWTPFGGGNNNEVVFSRDLNGAGDGFAFSAPLVLSTDAAQNGCLNHGAELAQEANSGDLYVAWTTFCNGIGDGADSSVWVARSTDDGQNFGAPVQVATLDNVNPAIATGFRTRSFASIDIDAATGRAFVVWADYTDADGGDADILISSSIDNAGWTAPSGVDVETDPDGQFMPWVDVAQGRVHVAYYSNDDETNNYNVFLSYAAVAATPAFTAVQVNSQPTPEATGFLGDYLAVDVGPDNVVHPSWGDGRAGVGGATDAWSARVDFSPPTTIAGTASPNPVAWGQNTTVTATVTGAHGENEQFIPVRFAVASSGTPSDTTGTGTTNAAGQSTFSYSNGTAGSDTVTIWADLDEDTIQDAGETTPVTVTWQKHPTTAAYTGPASGEYHDPLTVSGTLRDALTSAALPGQTLTIGFGTDTCTGVTNAGGVATCGFTPQQVPGPYTATASFAGSTQYEATTSPGVAFTLNKEQTTLTYTGPAFAGNGDPATLSARLTEDDPTPVAGRTVQLTLGTGSGAQSCSGVTNAGGIASCTIASVNQPGGPTTVTAAFAGDAYYLPSTTSASVVVFTWTPGGNFVIGDGNATVGATATFWSDTWYLANSVSGGTAPNSFKGFSNDPAGRTTCGGSWRTLPGNSPPPTNALPRYTAVLVTSKVVKNGNIINGTKPAIAIVRVNPGYSPSPGHPGTATVLGLLCS